MTEAQEAGIPYFMVGHVGDGNFHMGYLIDPDHARRTRDGRAAEPPAGGARTEAGRHLHWRARRGPAQEDFLVEETGSGAVDMMRTIKRALDPLNILNPGKIFSL